MSQPIIPTNRTESLKLALEEQRKDYDTLHSLHEGIKIKNVTYLAAALGTLGLLYTTTSGSSIQERLFIPHQIYGVIFYGAGVILLLSAIIALMVALVKARQWQTAYDNDQEESLLDDYEKYLTYMHRRYLKVSVNNTRCYEYRRYLLDSSFLPMVIGATILLLLKTFGE